MTSDTDVTVVIPVKPWSLSKSRLKLPHGDREELARAFALDVIDAVTASRLVGQVVFVTAEREINKVAASNGAVVLSDRPLLSPDGLNMAIDSGRRWAMIARPNCNMVVVPADLPSMTTAAFDQALGLLRRHAMAFAPDAQGQGTSLTWVKAPHLLRTSYGSKSAARHSKQGFRAVWDIDVRARRDVDTRSDLAEARSLGVGPHTAAAVAQLLTSPSRPR